MFALFRAILPLVLFSVIPVFPARAEEKKAPLEEGRLFNESDAPDALATLLRFYNYDMLRLASIDTEYSPKRNLTFSATLPPLAIAFRGQPGRVWPKLAIPDGPITVEKLLEEIAHQSSLGFHRTPHLWVMGEKEAVIDVRIREVTAQQLDTYRALSPIPFLSFEGCTVGEALQFVASELNHEQGPGKKTLTWKLSQQTLDRTIGTVEARPMPLLDQLAVLSLATGVAFEIKGDQILAVERPK